jgi:serine phosphatase RsbU (regulator of sigma subunit)
MALSGEVAYVEAEVVLSPGDLIILTSDGVVEATNARDELFGFDRLEQAVAAGPTTSAEAMLKHLKAEVAAFVGQTEPLMTDDSGGTGEVHHFTIYEGVERPSWDDNE